MNIGDVLELRYEHPAVCDTYVCAVVAFLEPQFVTQLLVLDDPLDEFQGKTTILCTTWKLREWLVKRWT